jgi:hypothetical protein
VGKGPEIEYLWDWDHPTFSSGQNAGPFQMIWNNEPEKHIFLQVVENHCSSMFLKSCVPEAGSLLLF